jgi:hypothetical protein
MEALARSNAATNVEDEGFLVGMREKEPGDLQDPSACATLNTVVARVREDDGKVVGKSS